MLLFDTLLSVIAPHDCLGCSREGSLLCIECSESLEYIPERCYMCKRLTKNSAPCSSCRSKSGLRHVWVRTLYRSLAQELVASVKFGRAQAGTVRMGDLMAEMLPYYPAGTIVTHVPTATNRIRQRGYDQSQLLAQHIAKQMGCSYKPLLLRMGHARQVGATRTERIRHMREAYVPRNVSDVAGSTVLLVDDVLTTGASVEAATRCIRQMGAKHVDVIVFAQKQ